MFDSVKVGDHVLVCRAFFGKLDYSQQVVVYVGRSYFRTKNSTYRKADGQPKSKQNSYTIEYAVPLTDPDYVKWYEDHAEARRLSAAKTALGSASPEVRAKVFEMLGV